MNGNTFHDEKRASGYDAEELWAHKLNSEALENLKRRSEGEEADADEDEDEVFDILVVHIIVVPVDDPFQE